MEVENIPIKENPTLLPFDYRHYRGSVEQDANKLYEAMHGLGTNEKTIIDILGRRTRQQRKEIASKFQSMYGKRLEDKLTSELTSDFETLCVELLLGPAEFDAKQLYKAIHRLGTDENAIIEIICSRTNNELIEIEATYKTMFRKDLMVDVKGDTGSGLGGLLLNLLQDKKPECTEVDREVAKQRAQKLFDARKSENGLMCLITECSFALLRAVFEEYPKIAKRDIEHCISANVSGDLKHGLLAIVRVIRNKPGYFARQLREAMKGAGTDEDALNRIVTSRCEVDMVQIKEEFYKEYRQPLANVIKDETSGDYRSMLLTLIGERF